MLLKKAPVGDAALVATLGEDLAGLRDRALLTLGWATVRRRRQRQHPEKPRADTKPAAAARYTTAVHLLESGVELNVIRGWLGHADMSTTNHYAEINTKAKEEALRACDPFGADGGGRTTPRSRDTLKL